MICPLTDEVVGADVCRGCAGHVVEPAHEVEIAVGAAGDEVDTIEIAEEEYCVL